MVSDSEYRRGRSVFSALRVHLVFVTRYRRGALNDDMLNLCEATMRDICADFDARLVEFTGEDDHVHLLIEYPPKVAVSRLVNSLKGVSARRLRDEYTERVNRHSINGHLWSPSYLAASGDGAPTSIIRQYIEQQRQPPRTPGRPNLTR
ncbi:IS200/IS605 family transposase [Nocardia cyriacigeorgica]|uniref:IS200/IS605 family transposase n=1 Tax=Nocardia cyriacigeorgica TaxID=135487 RepID=UPI00248F71E2|nr:IS200/IS605 family transposase [Nocardia cyriacigeorgica]